MCCRKMDFVNETYNFSMAVRNPTFTSYTSFVPIKDLCKGLVGFDLMLMISVLLLFNFLAFYNYKSLKEFDFELFGKTYDLVFFIPLGNACLLVLILVYAYNAF